MTYRTNLLLTAALCLLPLPVLAQTNPTHDASVHGDHDDASSSIIVSAAYPREKNDILSGTSVVTAAQLERVVRPTIGETLNRQPGVSATSFGPNASRPVLRGFQGERVRVLSDGIGSFDVSNTSVDHAVVINPLTADRIEVLRGPAALLYGSGAIGGVVNVIDSRIPRSVPQEPVHADLTATYGSAADQRSTGTRIDVPISGQLVLHFDGSYTKTGDLETGGHLLSAPLRAQAAASPDADIASLADLRGTLPNSAARTWELAGGAAFITEGGNMGFSVSRYDSVYGVPVRYSLDPSVEAEKVRLDMRQTRVDWRGEINPAAGPWESLRFRAGYADYRHDELEQDGAIGTSFFATGWEGRAEMVQRARGGWRGSTGAQFLIRNINIIGDEKFLPESEAQQFGLFTLQSLDLGRFRVEAGGRFEHSRVSANADNIIGNPALSRRFDALSGSLGGSVELTPGWRLGLNASTTERAPAIEELFANGPHAGTQAFEIGDPTLRKERARALELTLHGQAQGFSLSGSLYYSWFRNFIYENPTGGVIDGLPAFQISQANARHYGAEVEASVTIAQVGGTRISADGLADYTRATLADGRPVPRIPPLRLLGGLEARSNMVGGRLEVEWVSRQDRVATFETPTPGYTMVNASLDLKPLGSTSPLTLTLSADNIFDVVARRHASFLKDYAPLAGRDLRATARFSF